MGQELSSVIASSTMTVPNNIQYRSNGTFRSNMFTECYGTFHCSVASFQTLFNTQEGTGMVVYGKFRYNGAYQNGKEVCISFVSTPPINDTVVLTGNYLFSQVSISIRKVGDLYVISYNLSLPQDAGTIDMNM